MGKTNNKIIDTAGAATGSKNHSSTETTSESKRGRGRPRKNAGGEPAAAAGSETVTDVPRLVLVEDPTEDPQEQEEQQPAAPKNPSKRKRKEIQFEFKKDQLSILIKTTFDIIGSREGLEMWKISQKEADLLADPICALMAKNPMIDRITSEYGEWLALIVALGTVMLPRAFVMWAAKPDKKEKIKPYVALTESNKKQTSYPTANGDKGRTAGSSDRKLDRESSVASANISAELYNLVPAIQ